MADIRRTAEDWASKAPADDWGDGGIAETIAADLGRGILHMLDEPLLDDPVAAAVRAERQRIRQLAIDHQAKCTLLDTVYFGRRFADLIGEPDG